MIHVLDLDEGGPSRMVAVDKIGQILMLFGGREEVGRAVDDEGRSIDFLPKLREI